MGFLEEWERFCELTIPDVYKNNRWEIRVVGAAILNTAAKVWINAAQPLPGNFFLALVGTPRSGKTGILKCVRAVLYSSGLGVIERGTPEAVLEQVKNVKFGIFLWDEVEEVLKKARSYMNTLSNKLNDMYYLNTVTFMRTSKSPIILEEGDYYLSVMFAGLPQQWKAIESEFLGGFERRFLTLRIKGKIPLFELPHPSPMAAEILVKLRKYLKCLENYYFVLDPPDLKRYAEIVEREVADELKQSVVQDYTYKLWAAEQINSALDITNITEITQNNDHILCDVCDILDDTNVTNMIMIRNKKGLKISTNTSCDHTNPIVMEHYYIRPLIRSVTGISTVEEPEMAELIRRVEMFRRRNVVFLTLSNFVKEVLGTRNADWYRPRVKALEDAGYIRTVKDGRKIIVVLDPTARLCYNCTAYGDCQLAKQILEEAEELKEGVCCDDFQAAK